MITLMVDINTDDDCEVIYLGKSYCLYGEDLKFHREFFSRSQAIQYLSSEVKVVAGGKCSTWLCDLLKKACYDFRNEETNTVTFSGNQEIDIELRSDTPDPTESKMEEMSRQSMYCSGIKELRRKYGFGPTDSAPKPIKGWGK